ncbi:MULTISPECIES: SAV_6107 family HEPN domain-containing protein [Rhodococcus]|uniref:SAV-6107-like HEPN domain-containing protein n=1 Tax=Rhodococcoides kyotonense TaxID=398843 RepID=A0A177YP81_9NOCA|nr:MULTISPECIES: SAV_6107 family HEPN domain-containing protein [Rhodococcus]NIL74485.1 hypothetical protein [Rhodococcus sp. B10]OAK57412.1 hypothetical protein A3K89_00985 [Rhodococcus kyotonensis]
MATQVIRADVRPPVSPRARVLLGRADAFLSRSIGAADATERFLDCYMAALRGAAAILEVSPVSTSRARSRSAWVLLSKAAPEFDAWSEYFSGYSSIRADVQAGLSRSIDDVEADAFYAEVGRFLHAVEDFIGADTRLDRADGARRSMTA